MSDGLQVADRAVAQRQAELGAAEPRADRCDYHQPCDRPVTHVVGWPYPHPGHGHYCAVHAEQIAKIDDVTVALDGTDLGLTHTEPEAEVGTAQPEGKPTVAFERDDGLRLFEPANQATAIAGLVDRYGVPPFTALDRRQGYWQTRARQWKALGIKSEIGRDEDDGAWAGVSSMKGYEGKASIHAGMSIFDPVVTELAYHWFCPPGGLVLDPFAGGSVRGIVAGSGGRRYVGIDLSEDQVVANREQGEEILGNAGPEARMPEWISGDSNTVLSATDVQADMIFTCPPYGDLEVYSEHPADLSNMDARQFAAVYSEIVAKAVGRLRDDAFAAIVVGNYRDKRGMLLDLCGLTIRAFTAGGARYYNEAIILDPLGTAPVRAKRVFAAARKLVRVHQQLLVFVKGDPAAATEPCRTDLETDEADVPLEEEAAA